MPVFVDSNVLVYARDSSEPEKQPGAAAWVDRLWRTRGGRLSLQVLNEYYVTVTRKLTPGLEPDAARRDCRDLLAWHPVAIDPGLLESAWSIEDRFGFSFWDALIISAAHAANCDHLLTEDLEHGRDLDGVLVVDPFLVSPDSI